MYIHSSGIYISKTVEVSNGRECLNKPQRSNISNVMESLKWFYLNKWETRKKKKKSEDEIRKNGKVNPST